jgi:RecA-family ATPase
VSEYLSPEEALRAAGAVQELRPPILMPIDGGRADRKRRLVRTNTTVLMAKHFDPIRWIVEGYLPEGFSVLAGRQKLGKTWLAIDISLAVACGGVAMGAIEVEQGDVLYLDMENGERRIQRRIDTLYPDDRNCPDLSRLEWATEALPLDKGLIEALDDWRRSMRNPRLVVIDVLQRIKPAGTATRNAYENDYSIWSPLQSWATEHGIAVLGLNHTKKGGADDPLEALSGSNGLSACADTTLVLDRDGNGITLYVRGRDVDEKESALDFAAGVWTIQGDAAKVRMTSERQAILDALQDADEAMNPQEIAIAAGMKRNNVDRLLGKMAKAAEIRKVARGRYIRPERADLTDNGAPLYPGKNGKKVRNDENGNEFNGYDDAAI